MKFKIVIFREKTWSAQVHWMEFRWGSINHCWISQRWDKFSQSTPQHYSGDPEEMLKRAYSNWDIPGVYVEVKRLK